MGNWELAIWPMTSSGKNPRPSSAALKTVRRQVSARCAQELYPGEACLAKATISRNLPPPRASSGLRCAVEAAGHCLRPARQSRHRGAVLRQAGEVGRDPGHHCPAPRRAPVGGPLRTRGQAEPLPVRDQGTEGAAHANQADDVRTITAAMQAQFEAWIRENPEQWMWGNRRWS